MTRFRKMCESKAKQPMTPLNAVVEDMLDQGLTLDRATLYFQRVYVLRAGIKANGNGVQTSKLLHVHRNTLTRLLHKVGLPLVQPRRAEKVGHS